MKTFNDEIDALLRSGKKYIEFHICPTPWPHKLDIVDRVRWFNVDAMTPHDDAIFGVWIIILGVLV